jgi:glycosyltransferase involved in cell wall biosynthesis
MSAKPELIAFSHYKIGGVQNFYWNILSNDPDKNFDIKWIFYDNDNGDPKPLESYGVGEEIVIKLPLYEDERIYSYAARLNTYISDKQGVLLTNFPEELYTLHLYRKKKKTIFFTCHDENYLPFAVQFAFLIDVFIAHNEFFYNELIRLVPEKKDKIFYRPYGVSLPSKVREANLHQQLKVVIAARLQVSKGVLDIPAIDELLLAKGIKVQWTIVGDGLLKEELQKIMLPKGNAIFFTPSNNDAVRDIMLQNDIFILPSRLDGLPVAMLEAMSVGCVPVISAFNEGIFKVVTDDVGYVLPVGENELFADAIAQLHSNRNVLEEKSIAARKKIENEYDIIKRAKDYFDLFADYKNLKGTYQKRSSVYGGYLNHPSIPSFLNTVLKKVKYLIVRKAMAK